MKLLMYHMYPLYPIVRCISMPHHLSRVSAIGYLYMHLLRFRAGGVGMKLPSLHRINQWVKRKDLLTIFAIKRELARTHKKINNNLLDIIELPSDKQNLINNIKTRTAELNLNNVTRTMAYLDFYRWHPEIHWALLGHMVSRNGGWNMTDLRGEWLTRLLTEQEQYEFFSFLERGNWLIFQDVYPQFLLYEESLRRQENLFDLLQYFHVSVFMETMWNYFWQKGNFYVLAIALIINEQSYLEHRVVRNPHYQETVLKTLQFKLQDILSLNQIIFPYDGGIIGMTLHHFSSLHERILLGRRLYRLLFGKQETLEAIVRWSTDHPHTGSRKDYWPHLFHDLNESAASKIYLRRTEYCRLKPNASRVYSPTLQRAWPNRVHEDAEIGDWYKDAKVLYYLIDHEEYVEGDIHDTYCQTIEKIELAVMGKTAKHTILS